MIFLTYLRVKQTKIMHYEKIYLLLIYLCPVFSDLQRVFLTTFILLSL